MENTIPTLQGRNIFRKNEKIYIHISNDMPEYIGVRHRHDCVEIVYIIDGQATHIIEDKQFPVSKGDILVIAPGDVHAFMKSDSSESFLAYDLLFMPELTDEIRPDIGPLKSDLRLTGSSYNAFGDMFSKIHLEYINKEQFYQHIIKAYLFELLIKIMRKTLSSDIKSPNKKQIELIDKALDYIVQNFDKPINVESIAAKVYLNKYYFSKMFRNVTGVSVMQFLQQYRIGEACRQLICNDEKINTIAERCGFNDLKNFYSVFNKITGMTPGEYRAYYEKKQSE